MNPVAGLKIDFALMLSIGPPFPLDANTVHTHSTGVST